MKKTNYLTQILFFLIIICNYSCKRQSYDALNPQKITGGIKVERAVLKNGDMVVLDFKDSVSHSNIKIESSVKDSILSSVLSFKESNNWVKINTFDISLRKDLYRRKMTVSVKEMAEVLKDKFNVSELAKISDMLDAIPELLFGKLSREDYYKESSQAVFYHMGAVNSARRALLSNSEVCNCSINVTYIADKAPFTCLEDKYASSDAVLKSVLTLKARKLYGKSLNGEKILNYLKENSGKPISSSKATLLINAELKHFWENELTEDQRNTLINEQVQNYSKVHGKTTQASIPSVQSEEECTVDEISNRGFANKEWPIPANCIIMGIYMGTQCGCCGNYFSTCRCCSSLCLIHDIACIDCGWLCGPDCIPGC